YFLFIFIFYFFLWQGDKKGGPSVYKVAWDLHRNLSLYLRSTSEVPHGSSSLDSDAAGGGCLGPEPSTCPHVETELSG
ncbi:hypothetical protein LEMLEM_LOCUS20776, partial [Lemmus lemmus]